MDTMRCETALSSRHDSLTKLRRTSRHITCCIDTIMGTFLMLINLYTSLTVNFNAEIFDEINARYRSNSYEYALC